MKIFDSTSRGVTKYKTMSKKYQTMQRVFYLYGLLNYTYNLIYFKNNNGIRLAMMSERKTCLVERKIGNQHIVKFKLISEFQPRRRFDAILYELPQLENVLYGLFDDNRNLVHYRIDEDLVIPIISEFREDLIMLKQNMSHAIISLKYTTINNKLFWPTNQ